MTELATVADPSALPSLQRVTSSDAVAEVRDRARKASDRVTAQIATGQGLRRSVGHDPKSSAPGPVPWSEEADQSRQDAAAKSKKE